MRKTKKELKDYLIDLILVEYDLKTLICEDGLINYINKTFEKYSDERIFVDEEVILSYFADKTYSNINLPQDAHQFFDYDAYYNALVDEAMTDELIKVKIFGKTFYSFRKE